MLYVKFHVVLDYLASAYKSVKGGRVNIVEAFAVPAVNVDFEGEVFQVAVADADPKGSMFNIDLLLSPICD